MAAVSVLAAAVTACAREPAAAPSAPLPLDGLTELSWIAEGADTTAVLTLLPASCAAGTAGPLSAVGNAQGGEVLFHSPLLLGGQAAKAGVSCASCHRNGRGNPYFVFQGVSGAPGTADVSHGLFGKARDDDLFNPVAIPDLGLPEGKIRVSRTDPPALHAFLRAQILEEFDGPLPSDQVIYDLAAYLASYEPDCADAPPVRVLWEAELGRVRTAYLQSTAYQGADPSAAEAYIHAGRAALGRLHARFPAPEHDALRRHLVNWSKDMQAGQDESAFSIAYEVATESLKAHAATSLYDPETLRRALAAQDR